MNKNGLALSTVKASLVVATEACSFVGLSLYASAACTITVVDSGKTLLGPIIASALEHVQVFPCIPIACTAGLSATNSGGGYYTVFYGA